MEGKPSYLVPSVTTEAALELCLREKVGLFAVEGPLFLHSDVYHRISLSGYEVNAYPTRDLYLCRCVRDEDRFDMERYDIVYFFANHDGTNK